MVIKGHLTIPSLSWFWVSTRDSLTDWERILLEEYNLCKGVETLLDLCEHLNYYLEVPFYLTEDDRHHYKLLAYYHSELETMVNPPQDSVVSSIGFLSVTQHESYNLQTCVKGIVSVLTAHLPYLDKITKMDLFPDFENGVITYHLYLVSER